MVLAIFLSITAILLILIVRLFIMVKQLNSASAKLNYVIRQDAKKYFDEAADKIIDTNQQFQTSYTQIVHDGTMSALSDASVSLEKAINNAQKDAGDIIIKAREDAHRIVESAKKEADVCMNKALSQSADTIQWVMGQYVGQTFSDERHNELINKLLDEYIDEHRS